MKLNKKILAGALALAMGASAMAPVYADQTTTTKNPKTSKELINRDYEKAIEDFLAEIKKAEQLKKSIPSKRNSVESAKKEYNRLIEQSDANKVIKELHEHLDAYEKATTDKDTHKENLKTVINQAKQSPSKSNSSLKNYITKLEKYLKDNTGKDELNKAFSKATDPSFDMKLAKAKEKYETYNNELNYAIGYDQSFEYNKAKEAYLAVGGDLAKVKGFVKSYSILKENKAPKTTTEIDKKIEETVQKLQKKIDTLTYIKENLKETYKRNATIIDSAIAEGQRVLRLVGNK